MEINFTSKEESKRIQELEFLALSPSERVIRFFRLSQQINLFPTSVPKKDSTNFIIENRNRYKLIIQINIVHK